MNLHRSYSILGHIYIKVLSSGTHNVHGVCLTLIQTGFLLIAITDQIKVVLNAASIACILVS